MSIDQDRLGIRTPLPNLFIFITSTEVEHDVLRESIEDLHFESRKYGAMQEIKDLLSRVS